MTFESAAYVARYAMKKVNGDLAKAVYTVITEDGEIIERTPELLVMSKRPAIGRMWFEKFGKHVYTHDRVIARGVEMQPRAITISCYLMLFALWSRTFALRKAAFIRMIIRMRVIMFALLLLKLV